MCRNLSAPLLLALAFPFLTSVRVQAQPHTLSGYVQDAQTGERLPGAALFELDSRTGTTTNNFGFFSLHVPTDSARLLVSFVGYRPDTLVVALRQDTQKTVDLEPTALELDEVAVVADRDLRPGTNSISIPLEQIQKVPALVGEVDPVRVLQLLPGVKSGVEGTSGLYVRGGSPDQNLILLDGTPVYNASHLFGFLSVFNPDAIKNLELIKGGFPARYGGRLSSVLEVTMKEGDRKKRVVQGSVGLISSKLTVEGPLVKDRSSFIVSARRTYIDLLLRPLSSYRDGKPTAYFYDLSAKVNHTFSARDRLYLSVYAGDDRFGADLRDADLESSGRLGWGNATAALRWNRLWRPDLFMNLTLNYSRYGLDIHAEESRRYALGEGADDAAATSRVRYHSGIRDLASRFDFDWTPAPAHHLRFGFGSTWQTFQTGALEVVSADTQAGTDTTFGVGRIEGTALMAYVEDEVRLGSRLGVNVGAHASAFRVEGRLYGSVQPRLSARYATPWGWDVRSSFALAEQPLHLLSYSGSLGLPTDLWVPATRRVPPQRAWQASLGASRAMGRYEFSLDSYYKRMSGLIAYREGASYLASNRDWQDLVTTGRGRSYGAELLLRKRTGPTTGWLGYTLAYTTRAFADVDGGRPFPDRYDRRHDLALVVLRPLGSRLDGALTWTYASGNAATLPLARYKALSDGPFREEASYYGGRRNSFRMPAYHRMDVSLTYYFARRSERESALALSVYNAYNRQNPLFFVYETDGFFAGSRAEGKLQGFSLFPILPSVSYRFKF